ncbi:MAG TPA: transcriptional repressor LexA [Clostridia bacterium]|nr:transcriptional repressor LexA [Clostridia bacterium]
MRSKDESKMNRIAEYIDEVYFTANTVPTMQEIADHMNMTKSNVSSYIREMAERGMVTVKEGWRGVCTAKMSKTLSDIRRVPVVGEIACGTPILAEQNIGSYLTISASFLGAGSFFALRAKGDSMINADIDDGDFVIVRQQNTAEDGQIIVALIDGCATLKRFFKDNKKHMVRLHPENDEMEDMYFSSVDIQGVVKKVIKDVR